MGLCLQNLFQKYRKNYSKVATEAAVRRCSSKKVFLKILQYSPENTCVCSTLCLTNFIKREIPTQIFACEYWKIFNNSFIKELGGCF